MNQKKDHTVSGSSFPWNPGAYLSSKEAMDSLLSSMAGRGSGYAHNVRAVNVHISPRASGETPLFLPPSWPSAKPAGGAANKLAWTKDWVGPRGHLEGGDAVSLI